jgi:hypothetical protein
MTGQAIGELAEHLFLMGLAVTITTVWQMPMADMTETASNLSMAAAGSTPAVENFLVTGAAGGGVLIPFQGDLQRLMNRVALQTGAFLLPLQMWLVTLGAGGTLAVFGAVAVDTGQIGVGARRFPQSPVNGLMTIPADLTQNLGGRQQQGRMGILVTIKTRHYFVTMRQGCMTLAAVGHQFVVVVAPGIVGVEDLMAILAGEAMPSSLFPQGGEMCQVTAAAFRRRHRHRHGGVDIFLLFAALVSGGNNSASAKEQGQYRPKPEPEKK